MNSTLQTMGMDEISKKQSLQRLGLNERPSASGGSFGWVCGMGFFVLSAVLLFSGCSEQVASDTEPPPQVNFTPRSADTNSVEVGIDAVPEGNYIYLSWLPSPATDLAGYRLYRQAEDSVGITDREMIKDELQVTEYIDPDSILAPNQQTGLSQGFIYWVTAYDESDNESSFSQETYYQLMDKPSLSVPVVQGDSLIMSWSYNPPDPTITSGFIVRLHHYESSNWVPIFTENYQLFSPLSTVYSGPILPGNYRFQVDVVGASSQSDHPSGSEAAVEFTL